VDLYCETDEDLDAAIKVIKEDSVFVEHEEQDELEQGEQREVATEPAAVEETVMVGRRAELLARRKSIDEDRERRDAMAAGTVRQKLDQEIAK
jgi:hypothetical protein